MRLTADKVVTWTCDAPAGVTPEQVYFGPDPLGLGGFQVAVALATAPPSREALRVLFKDRRGKRQIELVVVVLHDGTAHLFGPDPQSQPIELPIKQAQRQLQSVLSEPDVLAATERFTAFRKANDTTGRAGFANSGLFASHHITSNVPQRQDWDVLSQKAAPLLSKRGKQLVEALGFVTQPGPNGTMLLSIGGEPPRAVAVLLDDTEPFEAKTQRFQLSPVAFGLAVASRQQVPWLVVLRKDQIRLYPGRDGVGVGSKGQAETYFEIDLATVDAEYAALLPLIFSAEALQAGGTADELLRDSARYATELSARLRERIYDEIVPQVAVEIAQRLTRTAAVQLDSDGLAVAYRVTLHLLFRLIFQAYAEDRGLLPAGRNEGFDANSLKTNARRLLESDPEDFGTASTIWYDLLQVWNAIDQGNPQWQIPSYNGGLFSTDPNRSPEGALLAKMELPDSVLGPALKSLLIDVSDDGVPGPVDFRSLSVREFGTIYEGLLESSLSVAAEDLTVDTNGAWIPARDGQEVHAPSGSPYFHTASGERKATGSYFTPKIVVDHLIETSVTPALKAHLKTIDDHLSTGDSAAAARLFFDFRVADLAMGSGHFLVAAVDKIEALMRDFLTAHSVPGVTEELLRLADVARDALGTDDVAKSEVDQVGLLRRQVARRCIYGLDINSMAVELARLALWIHTFVPGLPMSNLDHGLVNANSLTGIGTIEEALEALQPGRNPGQVDIFDEVLTDELASAKTLLEDVANASEANKAEVQEGARLLAQARGAADTARRIFDAAVAARAGEIDTGTIEDKESLLRVIDRPEVSDASRRLSPAHMPYLFPEVFLRENPGFDVLIGNPPWEKLQIEEHSFYSLAFPGLRGLSQQEAEVKLGIIRRERPDLVSQYQAATESTQLTQKVLAKGPYPGLNAGRPDLYKAFAWRMWHLVRTGGRVGVVLPRKALEASGMKDWRLTLLAEGTFSDAMVLTNTGGWVFEGVHGQYSIAVVSITADRTNSTSKSLVVRGPFTSQAEFIQGISNEPAPIQVSELLQWSRNGAFPLLPNPSSLDVFLTIRAHPRLDMDTTDFSVRGLREWNATDDKHRFVFAEAPGLIPVYKGDSFDLWNPSTGSVYAYADPKSMELALQERRMNQARTRRSAFYGMPDSWVRDVSTLPMHHPRIAWRDVTNRTNRRTLVAALVPPEIVMVHQAYYLFFRRGTAAEQAFVLGVLSSIPFDWYARQMVESHATVEFLLGAPMPRPAKDSLVGARVTEIAGRLAAVDDRYAEWASAVGVPVNSLENQSDKNDLIAELDALVSLLYGLAEDQVEHIFSTFHRGWDYGARLDATLTHYRLWKDKT